MRLTPEKRGVRNYFLSLMKDERDSPPDIAVKWVLKLLSYVYLCAVKSVDLMYSRGIKKRYRIPVPVVSVGNLSVGGTGKTPCAVMIAEYLSGRGMRPAILMRGYGGDEDRMVRDQLPDIPVYTGRDRVKSANRAVGDGYNVLVLDDGFQHRRIKRDLDILLADTFTLLGNGSVLPRGVLREPLSAAVRADIIVLTKPVYRGTRDPERMKRRAESLFPGKTLAVSRYNVSFLTDVTGETYAAGELRGKRVCLVSGIGDPDHFEFVARDMGADVAARIDYPDHHRYTPADVREIRDTADNSAADMILVTAKDHVKMDRLDTACLEERLFVVHMKMELDEGKEGLVAGLDSLLDGQGA